MEAGLVSVITPCYNGEKYIAETIQSVLNQTYTQWEMIIIDDGSKDNSAQVVEQYAAGEPRIVFLQQENSGSAAARNNGIRHARGQYIALLDADDLWEPVFLEKQVAFLKEKQAVCVYSSYRCINENSAEILHPVICRPETDYKDMTVMNRIGCLTGLYNTERYGKIYLREELKSVRDDYAYWLDIVKLENAAYGNPEILASYRVLSNSTTGNKRKLISKQYSFYRDYLHFGVWKSVANTISWGINGLNKYRR